MAAPREVRTDRLLLRPFLASDIAAYAAIRRKPEVMRYLPAPTSDPDEIDCRSAETVRAFAAAWDEVGYGPWAVIERASGRLVGHHGLRMVAEMGGQTEVLYTLDPAVWGRGFATEAGRAALDHGFGPAGLDRIVAWALPGNTRSRRVMERLGMVRRDGLVTFKNFDVVEYAIGRPEWRTTGDAPKEEWAHDP